MVLARFLTLSCILLCSAAQNITSLKNALSAHGVSAIYPTDENFRTVSHAYNRRLSISPLAVVFPTSVVQVSTAVKAAAAQNLPVVARSGGHSALGNSVGGKNGAFVVDMSKLKAITVESSNSTARIETGNLLGDVALALNAKGRAMPHGTCPTVGIGGHSGYGGFGFTSRAWGLALDAVKSATVVLANGSIVIASANSNSDLFWAIRGASPSFGIVTSIEVQTFPAPSSTVAFEYVWDSLDIATASSAILAFQDFTTTNLPAAFGANLIFNKGSASGKVALTFLGAYYENPKALNTILAPYLSVLPKVASNKTALGTYIDSLYFLSDWIGTPFSNFSASPTLSFYSKSIMTPESVPMSVAAIEALVTYIATKGFSSNMDWFVLFELFGGTNSAINAVPLDATAFAKRDTLFTIQFFSHFNPTLPYPATGFTLVDGMVESVLANSPSNWNYGAYLNYIDDRLTNAVNLYHGSHYPRLQTIKAVLDPEDTFRFPVGVAGKKQAVVNAEIFQTPFGISQ
ncbi:hypothetical protein FB451DRAFT_55770 [Mycena latifolia]|nr:hypothetical protein FB451DRAFT_55770 [Mycena latifolia]